MTDAEREKYQRWWIESSGLSARELYEIAVGLVGAAIAGGIRGRAVFEPGAN